MTDMKEFYKDLSKLAKKRRTFLAWKHRKLQEMKAELCDDEKFNWDLRSCLEHTAHCLRYVKEDRKGYDPIFFINQWYKKPLERYMKITGKYNSLIENREYSMHNKSSWMSYNYAFMKKYNLSSLDIEHNEELYRIYDKVIYMQEVVTTQF